jgi:hypothetical protein
MKSAFISVAAAGTAIHQEAVREDLLPTLHWDSGVVVLAVERWTAGTDLGVVDGSTDTSCTDSHGLHNFRRWCSDVASHN